VEESVTKADMLTYVFIFETFFLVLTRVTAFFAYAPFLGGTSVPTTVKVGLSFLTSVSIYPLLNFQGFQTAMDLVAFTALIFREVLIGLALGFVCNMIFEAIKLAGSVFDMQVGFGIVSVVDPEADTEVSIMAIFKYFVALIAFIGCDGYHILIYALGRSFREIGVGEFFSMGAMSGILTRQFSSMVEIGFQISLPMMGSILLATVVLGIMAKATPRVQVFLLSFPLRIYVGLVTVMALLPALISYFFQLFEKMGQDMVEVMKV
jgi:flagellar biosynthetic protein FliR